MDQDDFKDITKERSRYYYPEETYSLVPDVTCYTESLFSYPPEPESGWFALQVYKGKEDYVQYKIAELNKEYPDDIYEAYLPRQIIESVEAYPAKTMPSGAFTLGFQRVITNGVLQVPGMVLVHMKADEEIWARLHEIPYVRKHKNDRLPSPLLPEARRLLGIDVRRGTHNLKEGDSCIWLRGSGSRVYTVDSIDREKKEAVCRAQFSGEETAVTYPLIELIEFRRTEEEEKLWDDTDEYMEMFDEEWLSED